ncbi:hypothetical protein BJ170DRAFT_403804 [Xylariales sp. AK1849]|nr:hypothetical protein BJ170DRAFT_403804 [Xylariales sp. AK1849]
MDIVSQAGCTTIFTYTKLYVQRTHHNEWWLLSDGYGHCLALQGGHHAWLCNLAAIAELIRHDNPQPFEVVVAKDLNASQYCLGCYKASYRNCPRYKRNTKHFLLQLSQRAAMSQWILKNSKSLARSGVSRTKTQSLQWQISQHMHSTSVAVALRLLPHAVKTTAARSSHTPEYSLCEALPVDRLLPSWRKSLWDLPWGPYENRFNTASAAGRPYIDPPFLLRRLTPYYSSAACLQRQGLTMAPMFMDALVDPKQATLPSIHTKTLMCSSFED